MRYLFVYDDKDNGCTIVEKHQVEQTLMQSVKSVKARGFSCSIQIICEVKSELRLEPVEVVTDYVFVQV